jgi:uncharacterized tellurite resistance protein B-like protein
MPATKPLPAPTLLDLSGLTERQRLAFYGALFALAAADDAIDERESDQILESLHLEGLSGDARERAFALSISPPSLRTCLDLLKEADESIRRGLMLNLVDVALADGEIEPGEPQTLEAVRVELGISPEEVATMHTYAYQIRERGTGPAARPMAYPEGLS